MAASRTAVAAVLLTLATAGTALAGPATTNSDGDVLVLSVGVTPPAASTARTPQGVGLQIDAFAGNRVAANQAIPTNSITFTLPRGLVENGTEFPACTITPDAISPCTPATQLGSGTAEIALLNPGGEAPSFTPARVTLYNGAPPTAGGPTSLALIARVRGRPEGELDFLVKPSPHGLIVSQELVATSGPGIGITKLSLTIPDRETTIRVKRHARVVHFLDAPMTCTGSWPFTLITTSAGRKPLVATDSEPCVRPGSLAAPH